MDRCRGARRENPARRFRGRSRTCRALSSWRDGDRRQAGRGRVPVEDLSQEVLATAIEKVRARAIRDPERLSGFVAGLARLMVMDYIRKERSRSAIEVKMPPVSGVHAPEAMNQLLQQEQAAMVRAVLGELESDRRSRNPVPLLSRRRRQRAHLPRPRADRGPLQPRAPPGPRPLSRPAPAVDGGARHGRRPAMISLLDAL